MVYTKQQFLEDLSIVSSIAVPNILPKPFNELVPYFYEYFDLPAGWGAVFRRIRPVVEPYVRQAIDRIVANPDLYTHYTTGNFSGGRLVDDYRKRYRAKILLLDR